MIDTHTHIYDSTFDEDREQVLERAREAGLTYLFLPAIDAQTHQAMFDLVRLDQTMCKPMMGVHPTSINKDNLEQELKAVEDFLAHPSKAGVEKFYAVGEVGLDLYWSKDFLTEQIEALEFQFSLALKYDLPLVIHVRDAWDQMLEVLERYKDRGLRGIMHAFSGDYATYLKIKELGDFAFGVGGVVTFKKSAVAELVASMDINDIVFETDSPYLTPVPFRGKRNESAYVRYVAEKVSELKCLPVSEVERITDFNAKRVFGVL